MKMENEVKELAYLIAAALIVPTIVLAIFLISGMGMGTALLYGMGAYGLLPIFILAAYLWIKRDSSSKAKVRAVLSTSIVAAVMVVACSIGLIFAFETESVSASLDEKGLTVTAPFVDEYIPYDEMDDVRLRNDVDYGSRRAGLGGKNVLSGNFKNDEFGNYKLAVHRSVENCIVIYHDDKVLAFNLDSSEKTEQFYNNLMLKRGT